MQGYVLTVFAMMALVFSDRAFAEGSVFIGMYGKVDYFFFFAALMYFDISCDVLSQWFSSVLVCIVIV